MTKEEQRLADDKMRVEIYRAFEEAAKLREESKKLASDRLWLPPTIAAAAVAGTMTAVYSLIQIFA